MTNQGNYGNWQDQQDALEAYKTYGGARNLFFVILLIGLFVIQGVFWTVNNRQTDNVDQSSNSLDILYKNRTPNADILDDYTYGYQFISDWRFTQNESNDKLDQNEKTETPKSKFKLEAISDNVLRITLKTCNLVLPYTAVLYCLVLLIGMKLALIGRLGGLSCSSKALFISLLAAVFILPWQKTLAPNVPSLLFTLDELINAKTDDVYGIIIYYGRFTGFAGFTAILLILAQWRSCQATKQIRSRINGGNNNLPLLDPDAGVTKSAAPNKQDDGADGPIPLS